MGIILESIYNKMGGMSHKQVETAMKTGTLRLDHRNLKTMPLTVSKLTPVVTVLNVSSNKLYELPDEISDYKLLTELNATCNRLTTLPVTIGELVELEYLKVAYNQLYILPPSIFRLKYLKELHMQNNKLDEFPKVFCELFYLDYLDLSYNKIPLVPDEVENLNVSELNLNANVINDLSERIAYCPRLKILRLQDNLLTIEQIHSSLFIDSNVCVLALDGNLFAIHDLHTVKGYDLYIKRLTIYKRTMQTHQHLTQQ